jgi:hypothetical protein
VPDLLTRPLLRRDDPAWGTRMPWLAAVLGAMWTLVAGFAMCVLPAMAWWIGDGASAPMIDPLRFGSWVWLVSHRVDVLVDGAIYDIAPLGLTILIVLLMYRSARWASHSAGVSTRRGAVAVVAPAVATYAIAGGALAMLGTSGGVSVEIIEAAGLCGVWALAATAAGVGIEAGLFRSEADRAPRELVVALRAGALATAGLLAWGGVLVVVSVAANAGRVAELASSVGAGGMGTGLLIVASLAYVPNAVAWAAAFSLGPGFAVGTDTAVAPTAVELGLVPALPLLAGLPASVTPVVWLVVAGPVVVGALTGYFVHRELRGDASPARIAATGFGAGGVAMVLMALASSLSSGSAGDGRMTVIGPESGEVALASLLVIGAMAAGATFLLSVIARTRAVPADDEMGSGNLREP